MKPFFKRIASEVKIKVTAFDSLTLAYAEAYMALEAHRLAKEGKSVAEILPYLEKIRDNDKIFFAVDTLLYLVKNGRLSKLSGTLGTMLQLKPLLQLGDDGKVESIEKIRTTHKAHQRVLEKYIEETQGLNVLTYISHAHADEYVDWFKTEIKKAFRNVKLLSLTSHLLLVAHTGPKGIGIGYIKL
jgi:DegV family protein with EDD domain